jgi:hypothetical protein
MPQFVQRNNTQWWCWERLPHALFYAKFSLGKLRVIIIDHVQMILFAQTAAQLDRTTWAVCGTSPSANAPRIPLETPDRHGLMPDEPSAFFLFKPNLNRRRVPATAVGGCGLSECRSPQTR